MTSAAKFDSSGNALPYPGNTIVCDAVAGSDCHRALARLQQGLKTWPAADAFAFLPPDSFHMTLFRGVNDKRRLPDEWPRDLPLDMPLADITGIFARRLAGLSLPSGFRMRPLRLYTCATGETQLALEGFDEEEKIKLRDAREKLAWALNLERPGDRGYTFHITFTYRPRPVSADDQARLDALHEELFRAFAGEIEAVRVDGPVLCRYDDMLAFHPVLRLYVDGKRA